MASIPQHHPEGRSSLPSTASAALPQTAESLTVLTQDAALLETLMDVSAARIVAVQTEAELAVHILSGPGVAVIDVASMISSIAQFIAHLKSQFPDLVLVVAGGSQEQSALSAQISDGTVYRFLHKPLSPQRVKLSIDAAWRRHREAGGSRTVTQQAVRIVAPKRSFNLMWIAVAVGALALGGIWLTSHSPPPMSMAATVPAPTRAPVPAPVPVTEQTPPAPPPQPAALPMIAATVAPVSAVAAETQTTEPTPIPAADPTAESSFTEAARAQRWVGDVKVALAGKPSVAMTALPVPQIKEDPAAPAAALQKIHHVDPQYPDEARRKNTGGWVDLDLTVQPDGSVGKVAVLNTSTPGLFDQAAVAAARKWRYQPFDSAAQHTTVRIRFELK